MPRWGRQPTSLILSTITTTISTHISILEKIQPMLSTATSSLAVDAKSHLLSLPRPIDCSRDEGLRS